MRYYLAGPMTGYPQFNFPMFDRVASELRLRGLAIVSPAEMDSEAVRAAALASSDGKLQPGDKIADETWGEILARDVRVVADEIEAVIVLPDWHRSRGARLEVFVALLCSKPVLAYSSAGLKLLHPAEALVQIVKGFA
jgi:hypothetical protein